jgi:hypothetical protein
VSKTFATRLRALPLQWLAGATAVVGLAVSACFGGMAQAHSSEPATVAAGSLITGQPWSVTVVEGRILKSQTGLETQNRGDRWLVVIATVDITSVDSRSDVSDIIRLRGVTGLLTVKPQRILLSRDGTDVNFLNPGMPERVGFCWEQSPGVPLPKFVDVDVYNETLRANNLSGSVSGGNKDWLDPRVRATIHTPVQDKRT